MLRTLLLASLSRMPFIAIMMESLLCGNRLTALEWQAHTVEHGQLAVFDGLPVAVVNGSVSDIGSAEGNLFAERVQPLLTLMGFHPRLLMARPTARFKATLAAIRTDDVTRLTALGAAAQVAPMTLIEANALVDVQCSAVVRAAHAEQPLRVARNMDFFPAKALGPNTVVEIVRQTDARPFAAITWPGSTAVISGMNDAGLVACILLNHSGPTLPGGEPIGLRLAHILQNADSVASAVAQFAAAPVGSSHYVLFADTATATVVWQDHQGLQRDDLLGGWLTATNGERKDHQPVDVRGHCLAACIAQPPATIIDAAWMRQVLTASYMPGINAQAMVFTPATCSLELAVGTGIKPAAKATWWHLDLAQVFCDGDLTHIIVSTLPPSVPLVHYASAEYQP